MSEKITIRNFGPIKYLHLELTEIMVFIGPQASGKSTIAKLVYFFKYITSDSMLTTEAKDLFATFKKLFGDNDTLLQHSDSEIEYCYLNGLTITINKHGLHFHDLPKLYYKTILIPAGRAVYSLISDALFSLTSEAINIDPIILNFGRNIELSRKKLGNLITDSPEVDTLFQKFLKGTFRFVHGENRIYFESDQYVTLDRASSGQQEVFPLLLILLQVRYSGQDNFVTVEEPEAHLYPYTQYQLVEFIGQIYNAYPHRNRFIITTHSPYILTSFNNLLFAYQVAHLNHEEMRQPVTEIIAKQNWINPAHFSAYYVSNGGVESIYEGGLIADNTIDDASVEIAGDFDKLLEIYRVHQHG